MRSAIIRRLTPLALVLAALLVACSGGGDDESEAAAAIRAAPDKTVEAGSARVALNVAFSTTGGGGSTVTGAGEVDLRNRRGTLNIDLGAFGPGGTIETVLDGSNIYVKLPDGVLPGSRPWYRFDLATLGEQVGAGLGALGQLQQSDPTQVLAYLRGAAADMREVGEEDVRGASTTHYRGNVDLRRASESLSPDGKKAVEDAIQALGTSTFPTDVWLDGEGRVRKARFNLDSGEGPISSGSFELELYEFGVDVTVQVPPPDQVTDLTSLIPGPTTAPR